MKRFFLALLGLLAALATANAQVESVFFEARGGVEMKGGQPGFFGDHLNLHVKGKLSPALSYELRHRFAKQQYDPQNILNATDKLMLTWDISPRWSFTVGKQPVIVGGYEFDDVPVDQYFWNDFCNTIWQVYALGGLIVYKPSENQQFMLQVTQSLEHMGHADVFHGALVWQGRIAPWWKTLWSVNLMDDPYRHMMGYLASGNRFEAGPFALELDLMYRRSLVQKGRAGLDGSVVARADFSIGKQWLVFAKVGGDTNDASNVDPDGIAYDLTVVPGTSYFYGGGGVEFYPLGNQDLRVFALAWANNRQRELNARLGVVFRLYLFRR